MPGETGGVSDEISRPIAMTMGGLYAIGLYNSFEIYLFIFRRFPRRRGLYFWSMLCANTGVPLNSTFTLLRTYGVAPPGPLSFGMNIGWWLMVTGQSFVLYSRLHLLIGNPRSLRWLLCMIVTVFLFLQVPVAALLVVISYKPNNKGLKENVFDRIEIAQLITLSIQEAILSGMYVYTSSNTLKPMEIIKGPKVRRLLYQLIALFVVVVALDISLSKYKSRYPSLSIPSVVRAATSVRMMIYKWVLIVISV